MEATKEATCSERIAAAMAREEENLREIYETIDSNDGSMEAHEEAYNSLHDYALGMSTHQETVITLSWGGPASYLEVTHEGSEIIAVTYRFSDWFDTATQQLEEGSALYRYAQELIDVQEGNC
jgi:hypothetical protein